MTAQWISRWAGSYTFLSCSFWGKQYYISLQKYLGVHFDHTVFVHRKGTATFYVLDAELQALGAALAARVMTDATFATDVCAQLKKSTDVILPMFVLLQTHIPTWEEYHEFLRVFERHLALHVFVKKTVDFLQPDVLQQLMPVFTDARVYSESVYSESEKSFRALAQLIAQKEKRDAQELTCLTQTEFENYLQTGVLPEPAVLRERFTCAVIVSSRGAEEVLTGAAAEQCEEELRAPMSESANMLNGFSAYPGTVTGVVRVVLDPHVVQQFNQGDILVTGMTRPEFLHYIKKAAAVVTDVGGVLSHAAIMAREFKIPCIVGTVHGTTALHEGDTVTVDATTGTVCKA